MQLTIVRSWSAIAVGLLFTGVTAFVLMDDVVRHGAPITTKHVMTLAVLGGTVFFGHKIWSEFAALRVVNTLFCVALFVAGTTTCVLMSAGRNAEVVTHKVLAANAANTERERAMTDLTEAKARYLAALKAEEVECASGQGDKCRSKRITTQLRREDADAAEKVARAQKPEQVANGDIKAAADLVSRLPYVTADAGRIEALLQLAYPFLQSLFCEIAAVVGFSIGLGHARRPVQPLRQLPPPLPVSGTVSEPIETVPLEGWTPMSVMQARALARQARAEKVFEALREAAPLSNDELADRLGVSKGESSRRVAALAQAGLIRKQPAGRYVAISLRPLH